MAGPLERSGRRRSPVRARILAFAALLAATIAVIMVISASTENESDGPARGGGEGRGAERTTRRTERDRPPKEYVIEQGDSLIAIADEFGVTVKRIERLNPDVDPQALVTGQELKLR
jgi:hypothetical protein